MLKKLSFPVAIVIILCLGYFAGCKADPEENSALLNVKATIINGGAFATDGCGWLIRTDSANYSSDNLPDRYLVNNLKVVVTAAVTAKRSGCTGGVANFPGYVVIHIHSIDAINQ